MPVDSVDGVLAERIAALCTLVDSKMTNIQKQLDDLAEYVVGKQRFNHLATRVESLETFEHESRDWRRSVDRAVWLLSIIGGVCVSVVTAVLIAWATGHLQMVGQ